MIRKWLKFNTSFIELLKTSAAARAPEQKWPLDKPPGTPAGCSPAACPSGPALPLRLYSGPPPGGRGRGDGDRGEDGGPAVAETPAKTELFEIRGPQGAAFLVEAHTEDLEVVRRDLVRLKGDFFHFDRAIIELFTMKCLLTAEPPADGPDVMRLARVHAISSGCEDVVRIDGARRLLFVNSVDKTLRAKKMLEKLGYKISGIMYRFQPKERIDLEDRFRDMCREFVAAVDRLPNVISVTHNL